MGESRPAGASRQVDGARHDAPIAVAADAPVAANAPAATTAHPVGMFATVSLALLMLSLDGTIVATALHALQHGLGASIAWAGWTITAYSLGLVLMLPLSGKLSDRYGRRRVFLGSAIVFSAASLACGLATDIYLLIALRAVQAIGGAGFTPSATGIVVEHFGAARDRAVGLFGSIFPIGAMIGPILGGVFVTYWSWRGIFLVNVPIGALLVALTLRFIPPDRPRPVAPQGRLDLLGLVLLGAGLLAAMTGLSYLGDAGSGALWRSLALLVAAAVALGAFLQHANRRADPLIEPRFIHGGGFGAINVVNIVYGGAVAGLTALLPLYATTRYGIGALGSGTLLIAQSATMIIVSAAAAFALRRTGYRQPLYIGSILISAGVGAFFLAPVSLSPYGWLSAAAGLVGIGMGWVNPASRNAGLQLEPQHSAQLAALRSTGRQIGSIAAISLATAVIARAPHPSVAQAYVYATAAVLLLLTLPVIARVPEHKGAW